MSPGLHATLVGGAAFTALVSAGVCLARNPKLLSVRLHAVYGITAAWWLFAMSMVAGAESLARAQLWSWLAQAGVALLPGIVFHVNVAVAGLTPEHRRSIRAYYVLSIVSTTFCLASPALLRTPHLYRWGWYPAYSAWGVIPAGLLLAVMAHVIVIYRRAMRRYTPGTPPHARARAFHYGNCFAFLAVVDFLPAFGVPLYPFGFVNIALMYVATMFGTVRYRLIEITPQIAAERILETIPDGLLVVDPGRIVRVANAPAARLLGCRLQDLVNRALTTASGCGSLVPALDDLEAGRTTVEEVGLVAADGSPRIVAVTGARVVDDLGRPVAWVWLLRDLTDQRTAEEERRTLEGLIRHTQKMESLGVMAGGIAHDFNNVLMAIIGSADVARTRAARGEAVTTQIETIATAADHAAELTGQLLTYAGRGTSREEPVDLSGLCRETGDLIRSAVSRTADLRFDLADGLPVIRADQSQMRQVVLNLVTNASEALGKASGTITIRTEAAAADPNHGSSVPGAPRTTSSESVRLVVTDTGTGMDAESVAKVFDPFFTTKFAGRGLGLATVQRIVQAHRGTVHVTSRVGAGTTFDVVFPAVPGVTAVRNDSAPLAARWTTSGVALLADDEPDVRAVVRDMLTDIGFEVVEAVDGIEAVAAFSCRPADFAVVVLDLTMPGKNGVEAASAIRAVRPDVPIVCISGYSDSVGSDAALGGAPLLRKPFLAAALTTTIRAAIAAR